MASYVDGVLKIEFTRPLENGESDSLLGDAYFIFPVNGGTVDTGAETITQHANTPVVGGPFNIASDGTGGGMYLVSHIQFGGSILKCRILVLKDTVSVTMILAKYTMLHVNVFEPMVDSLF